MKNNKKFGGISPILTPCFKIGDEIYHNGREMEGKIVSLTKDKEPIGTKCEFWADVEFRDGVIWISQDATHIENLSGNSTMRHK